MNINLNKKEKFIYELRNLFESYGYTKLTVNFLENYESYSIGDFIEDKSILKLIHPNGKLYALRPDMTTPIAKRFANDKISNLTHKVYYSDTVFRIKNDISDNLLEINQMGVEVLGIKDSLTDIEILNLAKETLSKVDEKYHIDISHAGILEKLFDVVKLTKVNKEYIINSIENRAKSDLEQFLKKLEIRDNYIDSFIKLIELNGNFEKVLKEIKNDGILGTFVEIIEELEELNKYLNMYNIKADLDLSLVSNLKYYSGIIFKGYVPQISKSILGGGRYDKLSKNFGKNLPAIGFAVNLTDILVELNDNEKPQGAIIFYEEISKNLIKISEELREKIGIVKLEKNTELNEEDYLKLKKEYKDLYIFEDEQLEEKLWK